MINNGLIHVNQFYIEVVRLKYSQGLIDAVNKYNDNLDLIVDKILKLKIQFDEDSIEVDNLYSISGKLSVINNIKSRKQTEILLEEVINEYGYLLERMVRKR